MTFFLRIIASALFAPLVLADSSSNAVNERLPVRKAEMEAHWRVDCAGSWAAYIALREKSAGEACILPPELRHQLQLCVFIYQAPGEVFRHTGPDYQGAVSSVDIAGDCGKK
ncbi:MAG: hypothetical protein IMF06_01760 [Proteobacteria bacterium]|nr:hypothetical protein [Pseudomonadota bacterium]